MSFIEFISQPWHWAFSGAMIALNMFLLLYFGQNFGVSSTLRTMCAVGGAGQKVSFFDFNWKDQVWNIVFISGAVIGGYIASNFLQSPMPVEIAPSTVAYLQDMGVTTPQTIEEGHGYLPTELFNFETLFSIKGIILMVVGGFLIGFGARWAGGCTSGHAISGLSNLQIPSLIAVVGFFIGGLLMTHFFLPAILSL